jgi:hypothetical protein
MILLMNTINITCELQTINDEKYEISLKGFIFVFDEEKYIVTTNHGLPIKSCYLTDNTENKLKIHIDSIWNELLILKSENSIENMKPIIKHKNKIIKNNEILFIRNDVLEIRLTNAVPHFLCVNSVPTNPKILYIKADILDENIVERSFSGSPVFNENNKIIGILSKKNINDNTVYIIPIYLLIKTLNKKNNNSFFAIDYDLPIKKINTSHVKNNCILHKPLGIMVDLNTYYLIEGDEKTYENIDGNDIMYTNITNYLYIDNNKDLVLDKWNYKLTVRLYSLIRTIYSDISSELFEFLKNNYQNKIIVYINKSKLRNKKYYEIDNNQINLKLVITSDGVSSK